MAYTVEGDPPVFKLLFEVENDDDLLECTSSGELVKKLLVLPAMTSATDIEATLRHELFL